MRGRRQGAPQGARKSPARRHGGSARTGPIGIALAPLVPSLIAAALGDEEPFHRSPGAFSEPSKRQYDGAIPRVNPVLLHGEPPSVTLLPLRARSEANHRGSSLRGAGVRRHRHDRALLRVLTLGGHDDRIRAGRTPQIRVDGEPQLTDPGLFSVSGALPSPRSPAFKHAIGVRLCTAPAPPPAARRVWSGDPDPGGADQSVPGRFPPARRSSTQQAGPLCESPGERPFHATGLPPAA